MKDFSRGGSALFEDKCILVTGGTGSLGRALVCRLLSGQFGPPRRITVFSRDEGKHLEMRMRIHEMASSPSARIPSGWAHVLRFRVGDVRDADSVAAALRGVQVVFHAAGLKQVPTCEYFPDEAVATNIRGAERIVRAIETGGMPIEAVVGVSSDKACLPVNVMGMTKALQERVFISANLRCDGTRFTCARYGNVLASRGSVIPVLHRQIRAGGPVTITRREMTRFLLPQALAVQTIVDAYRMGRPGEILVPRGPAAELGTLARCLVGDRPQDIRESGARPGEKQHEIMVSDHEAPRTVARDDYYVIRPDLPELAGGEAERPALSREYGSRDAVVGPAETLEILRRERLLVEDDPDFAEPR
ncbi:MAG: polysaccharide biosynthesis protein [Planctomycetota bacterium]